jgi:hypothetical protein
MSRLERAQNWFNKINPTRDDQIYVGIDVHKKAGHIALWLNDTPATDLVRPTGYTLARQPLTEALNCADAIPIITYC